MTVDQDLRTGIAPEIPPTHPSVPEKKPFQPWHKPRKQYIRREQWLKEIFALFTGEYLEGRPLKYFTLPGEDLIDLKMLACECKSRGIDPKILGFNEDLETSIDGDEISRIIAINEISAQISDGCCILPDNFTDLSDEESLASNYLHRFRCFDIVNLDFCNSFFNRKYELKHRALFNLITHQMQKRAEPWLLFLTTRSDTNENLTPYWAGVNQNFLADSPFINHFKTVFGSSSINDSNGLKFNTQLIEHNKSATFTKLFGVAFGKWLLNLLMNEAPYFIVEMLDSYWYRVDDNQDPNMLSLAFKISKHPEVKEDPSGIVPTEGSDYPDELGYAMNILRKVHTIVDLDRIVFESDELYAKLTEETKQFLSNPGYEMEKFEAWANQKRIRLSKDQVWVAPSLIKSSTGSSWE